MAWEKLEMNSYLMTIAASVIVGLLALLGLQTYRLDQCQLKAKQLDPCQEVREFEGEARDATDDVLVGDISQP